MALSTALSYAVAGLRVTSAQTALSSRNVSFAHDPDYVRRQSHLTSLPGGAISVASYNRSADRRLLDKLLDTTSSAAGKQAALDALSQLAATIGDPESENSIASLVAKLQQSLQSFEADPSSLTLGSAVLSQASSLARSVNGASDTIQSLRTQADQDMVASVGRVNSLLSQFKVANDAVVRGQGTAADLGDSLDQRDRILKQLSEEIGIRTITRANNDLAIYTDSGVTLFETNARTVTMSPTLAYDPAAVGGAVYVDGVKISGSPSAMPARAGKLYALAEIRDRTCVTYQTQLDEMARGIIEIFSESDQSATPGLADATGLFTYAGGPGLPASGIAVTGLAAQLTVSSQADPAKGGSPALIRDGGFNGAAYVYNASAESGFQNRISQLIERFDTERTFDGAAQIGASTNIKDFSAAAAGWVEGQRQALDQSATFEVALRSRANEALLRKTGVNIDEEMSTMLDLERAYQASSKVIATVDQMLKTLIDAVG